MSGLTVLTTGPLATFQDRGRPGYAHLGVPRSGAADLIAFDRANRLVGNEPSAIGIETTFGGWSARAHGDLLMAVTGPATTVTVGGRAVGVNAAFPVRSGERVEVRSPAAGCRHYVCVRGGLSAPTTLGSAATDSLSGLGPPPLHGGDEIAIGDQAAAWPSALLAPQPARPAGPVRLVLRPGPRSDHLADPAELETLAWSVNAASNRIGVRLDPVGAEDPEAPALRLQPGAGQLPSEGVPLGGLQVPPAGQPVIFLADHPVTGGYPVVAVLSPESLSRAAQLVVGERVTLRLG